MQKWKWEGTDWALEKGPSLTVLVVAGCQNTGLVHLFSEKLNSKLLVIFSHRDVQHFKNECFREAAVIVAGIILITMSLADILF